MADARSSDIDNNFLAGGSSFFITVSRIAIPVIVFTVLNRLLLAPCVLSNEAYSQPWLLPQIGLYYCSSPSYLAGIGIIFVGCLINRHTLWLSWSQQGIPAQFRWFVCLVALLHAWLFSSYEYNFFVAESHFADRLLVLLLGAAVVWKPFFVIPLLLFSWPIHGQFQGPLGGYAWTVVYLPARLLLLFLCTILAQPFLRRVAREPKEDFALTEFPLLACTLIAGHYFTPGLAKAWMGWFHNNDTHLLLVNTHAGGWLHFLETTFVDQLARNMKAMGFVLNGFTFIAEIGALLACWSGRSMRVLVAIWLLMHVAICACSSILFWPWIIIDVLLVACFFGDFDPLALALSRVENEQRKQHRLILRFASVGLIATAFAWTGAVTLAWFDSPVTYNHRFTALMSDGGELPLATSVFAPFDYPITLNNFGQVVDEPTLGVTWGAVNSRKNLAAYRAVSTTEDVLATESEIGVNRFDADSRKQIERFLKRFLEHGRYSENQPSWWFTTPSIIQNWRSRSLPDNKALVGIRVERQLSAFLDGQTKIVKVVPVIEVRLPD